MPVLNIVYYDPFDAEEEAYVARHYADGQRTELIKLFYELMRQWRNGDCITPIGTEAADARYYPDMADAGYKAGIYAMGQMIIRGHMRAYRAEKVSETEQLEQVAA